MGIPFGLVPALGLAVAVVLGGASATSAEPIATDAVNPINGIAVDAASAHPQRLLLATQYGLLSAAPDGVSVLVPGLEVGLTALASAPENPKALIASGFDATGQATGLLASANGGTTWSAAPNPANRPLAFRALSFSAADPQVIHAIADDLVVSRDGGKSWAAVGHLPKDTFSLAASALDADSLYAATMTGLQQSRDSGATWRSAYATSAPTTMVHAMPDKRIYAFVYGVGLISAQEPELDWQVVSSAFADRYMVNLTHDPAAPDRLFASVDTGAILTSADAGQSWGSFEGSDRATPANIAAGKQLFEANCQVCHGANGIGEAPGDPEARDEFGFKAPALNDDAHAWHHSDQNLISFIAEGSPRNTRMVAFKEILSPDDIANLVAYLKSRWSLRSLACQGGRHMGCMAMQ